jgi:hypothetical protein
MLLEHRQQIEQLLAPLNAYGRHALPPAAPARDTSQDRPALTRPLTCPLRRLETGGSESKTSASPWTTLSRGGMSPAPGSACGPLTFSDRLVRSAL